MNWLAAVSLLSLFTAVSTQGAAGISSGTRQVLLDMLKNMMSQTAPNQMKVDTRPAMPMPLPQPFKPQNPFFPPPFQMGPPVPPPPPQRPPTPNDGLFMDVPQTGGGAYGGGYGGAGYGGGYAGPPVMRSYQYCPPGPTTADHCKDQRLQEALYHPDGSPRYNWVPPRNPWDNSLPDTVKETARNMLMMKVNSRPNRTPTAKEFELMSYLGDPKELGGFGGGQFGR